MLILLLLLLQVAREPPQGCVCRPVPLSCLRTMFLISMFSCARLVIASAARRATLPVRDAGAHSPVPVAPRADGLLMLWAASSFTRPAAEREKGRSTEIRQWFEKQLATQLVLHGQLLHDRLYHCCQCFSCCRLHALKANPPDVDSRIPCPASPA
jgi:hypothetical protein